MAHTMLQPPAPSTDSTVSIELPLAQVGLEVITREWLGEALVLPAWLDCCSSSHRLSFSGTSLRVCLSLDSLLTPLLHPSRAEVQLWHLSPCN